MLSVHEMHVAYGKIKAVQGVSLEVPEGEIVALIGPNGAGKSTTLRALSGLLRPRSGHVQFRGRDITRVAPERRVDLRLALVPEGRGVLPSLSVLENLQMGAYRRRDKEKVQRDLIRVFDLFPILRERLTQRAGTLSGGQQQMLVLGRALLSDPLLLMLDEPSFGLAPQVVNEVFAKVQELRQGGTTLLIAEQRARQVLQMADRAYVFNAGRIVASGLAKDLLSNSDLTSLYLGDGAPAEATGIG